MTPVDVATTPAARARWLPVAAGCAAVLVGGWALTAAGALDRNPAWTADSGPFVSWGVPASRLAAQGCAVLTVGFLLGCLVFAPTAADGTLSAVARRHAQLAGAIAGLWAVAAFCQVWFTTADLTGVGLTGVQPSAFTDIAVYTAQGRAMLAAVVAANAVRLSLRLLRGPRGAVAALAATAAGILPAAFTGHAATSGDHNTATTSLALHIAASCVWVGGLVALLAHGRWQPADLPRAAHRFSRLALVCFLAVAGTGALNGWLRIGTLDNLLSSDYGMLLQLKTLTLVALGAAGWWHRERTLPALTRGVPAERGLFARFAAVEVVVMAAGFGLATALARSVPPRLTGNGGHSVNEMLLGYSMPPEPTPARLLWDVRPDLFFAAVCGVAAVGYLRGVRRLHRAGTGWPARRALCWLAGVGVLLVATSSGLARYGPVLFSVHLSQHLLAAVAAPILLVLGAPVALALRALPASPDPAHPGAREWLTAVRGSRSVRLLGRPALAAPLWMAGAYATYLTGAYEYALRNHLAHLALYAFFVVSGVLFFGSLRSAGSRHRAALLAALALHTVAGVLMIRAGGPFAAAWFAELRIPWGPETSVDQGVHGPVVWAAAHCVALLGAVALLRSAPAAADRVAADQRPPDGPAARVTDAAALTGG